MPTWLQIGLGFAAGAVLTLLLLWPRLVRLGADLAARMRELDDLRANESRLKESFDSLVSQALPPAFDQFLTLASEKFAALRSEAVGDLDKRQEAIKNLLEPVKENLSKLEQRAGELEKARVDAYSRIDEQVKRLAESAAGIQERAQSLEGALRGSQTRGRWGEVALRNIVELAGMTEHCDFEEQATTAEGKRPDLLVHLPDGSEIAVDAKVPLGAYLEAQQATETSVRKRALAEHVRALRQHVRQLASREYAADLEGELDLVVMFLPSDAILGAAFEADPELQEEAWRSRVLIATPTTLVALLRTVAIYWQQKALAENAEQIAAAGRELYGRLRTFTGHFEWIGKGLERAMQGYNEAVGSLERSVLPSARRLKELHATTEAEIEAPALAQTTAREVTASELRAPADDDEPGS